ncbi:unnamed protein product, partial [Polarella glacialis]
LLASHWLREPPCCRSGPVRLVTTSSTCVGHRSLGNAISSNSNNSNNNNNNSNNTHKNNSNNSNFNRLNNSSRNTNNHSSSQLCVSSSSSSNQVRCSSSSIIPTGDRSSSTSMGPLSLAQEAWALTTGAGDERRNLDAEWEVFEARAVLRCSSLRGEEIVRLLHACTSAKRRPKRLLAKLAQEIPDKMPQFDAAGLCICLHAFAQMRSREDKLFAAVTRRLLQPSLRADLQAAHLTSLLYSHARALMSDKGLIRVASARLAQEADSLPTEDLATSLQAFATLRVQDVSFAASCSSAVARSVGSASLSALCDAMGALARLSVPSGSLQRGLAKRIRQERPQDLDALSAAEVSRLLFGIGGSDGSDEACRLLASRLERRIGELDGPRALVQAVEALAKSLCHDEQQGGGAPKALSNKLVAHMVDFSVKDVAATAVACQRLMVQDGAVLESLARQGLRKGWRFKPQYAQAVLRACRDAGFRHPAVQELWEGVQKAREEEQAAGKPREPQDDAVDSDEESTPVAENLSKAAAGQEVVWPLAQ